MAAQITIGKKKTEQPLKTYINFAEVSTEKTTNWLLAIPAILVILAAAAIFSKLAVADRYAALAQAQGNAEALRYDYETKVARLTQTGDLTELYYHYTWSDLDRDEAYGLRRDRIAGLLEFIAQQGIGVESASLSGSVLTIRVTGRSLQQISALSEALEGLSEVASCNVTTAQGEENEDGGGLVVLQGGTSTRVNVVNAQVNVHIRDYEDASEAEAAAAEGTNG